MGCIHIGGAIITVAPRYEAGVQPPSDRSDYLGWHEWAEVQHKAGLKQEQCGRCSRWNFPQELSGTVDEHTLHDSKGFQVTVRYKVCNSCLKRKERT